MTKLCRILARARHVALLMVPAMALGFGIRAARAADPAGFPAGFHRVELAPHFTERFADAPGNDIWQSLPAGLQSFHGVPFVVEGRCELTGMIAARDNDFFPPEITGIVVGRKARTLHLLHVSSHPEDLGMPLVK